MISVEMVGDERLVARSEKKHIRLEDHSRTRKWLRTMGSFRPLRIGLWDPFQMTEIHGL